jgi:hypothetical protein
VNTAVPRLLPAGDTQSDQKSIRSAQMRSSGLSVAMELETAGGPRRLFHTKRPQIERTFVGAGMRDVGGPRQ